jgi:hypothetical protein
MSGRNDTKTFLITFFFGLIVVGMVAVKFLMTRASEQPSATFTPEPAPAPAQAAVEQPVAPVSWNQVNGGVVQDADYWARDRAKREAQNAADLAAKQVVADNVRREQAAREKADASNTQRVLRQMRQDIINNTHSSATRVLPR